MATLSAVNLSDLEGGSRLDPEYYRPEMKELAEQLSFTALPLRVIAKRITQGPNPHFTEAGVPCLNGRNIVAGRVDLDNTNFVSQDEFEKLSRYRLREGDILVTLKGLGSIGQVALVTRDLEAIFSRDLGLIRLDASSGFMPEYVYACLSSAMGRQLLERGATGGTGQRTLTTSYLGSVPIQPASQRKQATIAELVRQCESGYEGERSRYSDAERVLFEDLKLGKERFSQPHSWSVNLSRAKGAHRLDAEHFQPKYAKLLARLRVAGRSKVLDDIATLIRRGRQPRYVEGGPVMVVNSRYVGKRHIKVDQAESTDERFWQEHEKARAIKYDVVMNSTGLGTIGRANCVLHDQQTVVDNHVTIIRVKKEECNPLYLAAYLNSTAGFMQTEKWLSGSSGQIEIYPSEIARFVIHLPPRRVQEKVAAFVQQSYEASRHARSLLEEAKSRAEAIIREGVAKHAEPATEDEREQRETWESLRKGLDRNRRGSRKLFP